MRRCCKKIDITSVGFIEICIHKALEKKKRARQAKGLIESFGDVHKLAQYMSCCIKARNIQLPPIRHKTIVDTNSGKVREISVESIIHQLYDYVAVYGAKELFDRKIGQYQCASIPKRGQVYGKNAIAKWLRDDVKNTKYAIKCDIRQCYPSIPHDRLIALLRRDIKNPTLLWLLGHLIHQFGGGLPIGSYLSQYLCNYYLSYAYRYASEGLGVMKTRRGKSQWINPVSHVLFYMDDILLLGSNKRQLRKAFERFRAYVKSFLGLDIKDSWQLFRVRYLDEGGMPRGNYIDMMGYRASRYNVTVRRRVFRKIIVDANKVHRKLKKKQPLRLKETRSLASRWGWLTNSNSRNVRLKYMRVFKAANKTIAAYAKGVKNYVAENREFGGDSGGRDCQPLGCGSSGCVAAQQH